MGRKRVKNRDSVRNLGFSYVPNKDYSIDDKDADNKLIAGSEIIEGIDEIVDRERTTRSEIIMRALAGYWHRHGEGNYQTLLPSYAPSGIKNNAQWASELVNNCIQNNVKEIYHRDIMRLLINEGYPSEKRIELAKMVLKLCREKKVSYTRG